MEAVNVAPLGRGGMPDYIEIGRRFFPQADWTGASARLDAMMELWCEGILVERGPAGEIRGYYTLWPITPEAYRGFLSGALKDADMNASCLPPRGGDTGHYWIMTAVAVEPRERALRKAIILALLADFRRRLGMHLPAHVVAHAATAAGLRFLARTGFAAPNPAEPAVHTLEVK